MAGPSLMSSIAEKLDDPRIPWKLLVLSFALGIFAFERYLAFRQLRVLYAKSPPKALQEYISLDTFNKSQAYSRTKLKFDFISSSYSILQEVAILTLNLLPKLWDYTAQWQSLHISTSYQGEIVHSLVFMVFFTIPMTVLNLPLSIYSTFRIEEKFGFNKQTPWLFFTDFIKGQILLFSLGLPLLSAILKIISYFGENFFYYLWLFFLVFQIIMISIYPILIQPLFNKFDPLSAGELKDKIEDLARKLKFPLTKLFVIDGSKRSAHSNAYFYGLPWSKRIVIFDTLIEQSDTDEVVAVLAHELGHWSMNHTTQSMIIGQIHLFIIFAIFSAFVNNSSVYQSFGFYREMPALIGFILFNDIFQPIDSFVGLLMHILSRKNEFEADAFAKKLGYCNQLGQALIKLQIKNLSSMNADRLYSAYHYSHPLLLERLNALDYISKKSK